MSANKFEQKCFLLFDTSFLCSFLSSIAKLRSLLAQLGDSTAHLTKMLNDSEHCDSIRQQVDIAREIAIEHIHKASNALMTEIHTHERECLSGWKEAKASTEVTVEDVSKRMNAFVAEKQKCLRGAEASDDELVL